MPQADAQHRRHLAQLLDHPHRHARLLRPAGPGRDDDAFRLGRGDFVHRHHVVAHHLHVGAELAEILNQVVGKRVVVVDDEHHSINNQQSTINNQQSQSPC
jgi:hypothetical protein